MWALQEPHTRVVSWGPLSHASFLRLSAQHYGTLCPLPTYSACAAFSDCWQRRLKAAKALEGSGVVVAAVDADAHKALASACHALPCSHLCCQDAALPRSQRL